MFRNLIDQLLQNRSGTSRKRALQRRRRAERTETLRHLRHEPLEARLVLATVTWDGGGADNNWSTAANWTGDALPMAADDAVFDATSAKNVTFDTAINIQSINVSAAYGGAVTANNAAVTTSGTQIYNSTVTLGAGVNFTGTTVQFVNTITGAANNLTVTGNADFDAAVNNVGTLQVTGTSNIGANVTATGAQTYGAAVTLDAGAAVNLTGTTVNTQNTLTGDANNLTITGNADFDGAVTAVAALAVTGTANIGANVTTTATQTYTGAVTLDAGAAVNLTGTTVNTQNTLTGDANNLTITGNADFDGAVTAVAALAVTGTANIGANVTTTATQTYTGAVTLDAGAAVNLTGTTVNTQNTLTGDANNLTITGNADFNGAVTAVAALAVTGTSNIGANVTTTATQTYTGAVTLDAGAAVNLTGTTVNTQNTLTGDANNLTITGNADFDGAVTAVAALAVTGTANIGANVTTTATQTYTGAVTLDAGAAVNLTGTTVNTQNTLTGDANNLTITGNADFDGAVTAVAALAVTGTSNIGANVTTTATQTYTGAVTLDAGAAVNLTGTTVNTQNTLTGDANNLTITGNADFDGAVTAVAALAVTGTANIGANVTTTATQTYTGAVTLDAGAAVNLTGTTVNTQNTLTGDANNLTITGNANIDGAVTAVAALAVTGTANIGANVTTTATQTYTGAVTLDAGAAVNLTGTTVNTQNTLTGDANNLTITGNADFDGAVTAVAALAVTGTANIGANVTTTATQTYTGAVTLDAGAAVNLTGTTVNTQNTLTGDANNLTITGNADFNGAVTAVAALAVTGTSNIGANVTTTATQTYTGAVTLDAGAAVNLTGTTVNTQNTLTGDANNLTITGNADFDGAVTAVAALAVTGTANIGANVTTTATQTYTGAVTLDAGAAVNLTGTTVNTQNTLTGDANNLTITGNADFDGAVTAVAALAVTGTSNIGANVTTTATQTYTGAVTLDAGAAVNLTGTTVNTQNTLTGDANNLTITGNADFDGAVTAVAALAVTGTANIGANVTTTATQTYTGAVTLDAGAAVNLTGTTVNTQNTLTGDANNLTITGNANIDGAVTAVAALAVTGTANIGANVTTTATQTYTGAVTLDAGAAVNLTGTTVNTQNTLTGDANNLTITGNADFDGAVTAVAALAVTGTANIGANVTTTATQTYTGAVTLDAGAAVNLTGTTVNTQNTLTGDANNLTITGNANIDGAVTAVAALAVTGTANIGANVTTTATQTYTGAVTLDAGAAVNLTGTTVNTQNTLTGDANNLTITGNADFNGAVTAVAALAVTGTSNIGANVTTTATQTYTGAVTLDAGAAVNLTGTTVNTQNTLTGDANNLTITGNADFDGAVTAVAALAVTGTANIGANVTTTATQTYTGAVTLDAGAAVNLTGTTVNTQNTLTGDANNLTITGNADFDGAVTAVAALAVTGTANIGANVTTTATQTYTGAVTLDAGAAVNLTGTTVNTQNTLTGDANNLTITGNANIDGAVTAVAALAVTGTANIGANVTTTATQTYTGAVTLDAGAAVNLTGTTVNTQNTLTGDANNLTITGNADFDGAVTMLAALLVTGTSNIGANVTTTGNQSYQGAVTVSADINLTSTGGTVNTQSTVEGTGAGTESLTVTGNADIDGAVGGTTALEFLAITGTTNLGANVTTSTAGGGSGNQTYQGAVTLSTSVVLSSGVAGGTIAFNSTLDGTTDFTENLTTTAGTGNIDFDGVVGGTIDIGAILINSAQKLTADAAINASSLTQTTGTGTTTLNGGTINGAVSVTNNAITLQTATLTTNSAVAGNNTLTALGGAININANLNTTTTGNNTLVVNAQGDDQFLNIGAFTVSTNNATISYLADDMNLNAGSSTNAGTARILLAPNDATDGVDLGDTADADANILEISDSEIGTFTTTSVVQIGNDSDGIGNTTGNPTTTGLFTVTANNFGVGTGGTFPTLALFVGNATANALTDSSGINQQNLRIQSVGSVNLDGNNDVDNLAIQVTGANSTIRFDDNDDLNITTVDTTVGVSTTGGGANQNIVVNAAETGSGTLTVLQHVNAGGATADATLTTTTGAQADSDIDLQNNVIATQTVTLDSQDDIIDTLQDNANGTVQGVNGLFTAVDSVGAAGAATTLKTTLTNLAGNVSVGADATSGFFVTETNGGGTLTVSTVGATNGVTTANGRPIAINTLNGTLTVSQPITVNGATGDGAITLTAGGAASNFVQNAPNGDIVTNDNTTVANAGITVTAGNDITINDSVTSQAGTIHFITGQANQDQFAGGATANVNSNNGLIVINANAVANTAGAVINSGTANTIVRPNAGGHTIDLGGADAATVLGLSQVDITPFTTTGGGTVIIGSSNDGASTPATGNAQSLPANGDGAIGGEFVTGNITQTAAADLTFTNAANVTLITQGSIGATAPATDFDLILQGTSGVFSLDANTTITGMAGSANATTGTADNTKLSVDAAIVAARSRTGGNIRLHLPSSQGAAVNTIDPLITGTDAADATTIVGRSSGLAANFNGINAGAGVIDLEVDDTSASGGTNRYLVTRQPLLTAGSTITVTALNDGIIQQVSGTAQTVGNNGNWSTGGANITTLHGEDLAPETATSVTENVFKIARLDTESAGGARGDVFINFHSHVVDNNTGATNVVADALSTADITDNSNANFGVGGDDIEIDINTITVPGGMIGALIVTKPTGDLSVAAVQTTNGPFQVKLLQPGATLTLTGNVVVAENNSFLAQASTVRVGAMVDVDSDGANVVEALFRGDEIDFTSGANDQIRVVDTDGDMAGVQQLRLEPLSVNTNIEVGQDTLLGQLNLDANDLNSIGQRVGGMTNWDRVFIGREDGTGTLTITTAVTFPDPVVFQAAGQGGRLIANGALTNTQPVADATQPGGTTTVPGFEWRGPGETTVWNANQTTTGTDIVVNDNLELDTDVVVDTTSGGGVSTGADLKVDGRIDGVDSEDGQNSLTADLGTGGDLVVTGNIGQRQRLETITVNQAAEVDFDGTLRLSTNLNLGDAVAGESVGNVTIDQPVNVAGTASIDLIGGAVLALHQGATFTSGGDFEQTSDTGAAATVQLGANVVTLDGAISFADAVTLTNNVAVNANDAGADETHNVTFFGTVDGGWSLVTNADDEALFLSAIGGSVPLTRWVVGGNVDNSSTTGAGTPLVVTTTEDIRVNGSIDTSTTAAASAGGAVTLTSTTGNVVVGAIDSSATGVAGNVTLTASPATGLIILGGNVGTAGAGTSGTFTANSPLILAATVTVNTNGGGTDSAVTFNHAIDGTTLAGQSLNIDAGTSTITLGPVGQGTPLATLNLDSTNATAAAVTLSGDVTATAIDVAGVANAATVSGFTLGNDVTLATQNTALDFGTSTINSTGVGLQGLTINTGAGSVDLDNVGTEASELAFIRVSTTGVVTLEDDIFANSVDLSNIAGGVTVNDGAAAVSTVTIDIDGATGDLNLRGTTTALSGTDNLQIVTAAGSDVVLGAVTEDAGSDSTLDIDGAGSVTLTGNIGTAAEPLNNLDLATADFTGRTILDAPFIGIWSDTAVDFGGSQITGTATGQNDLLINTSSGNTAITLDAVGSGTLTPIGALSLNAGTSEVNLEANVTASSAAVTATGNVDLINSVVIDTSAANGAVSFAAGTDIDATAANTETLVINAGTGSVTLQAVGAAVVLGGLTASGGTVEVDAVSVDAAGVVLSGPQGVTLGGNVTTTAGGAVSATGPVTLGADVTINTDGAAAADGNVTLDGTVNGAQALSIDAGAAGDVSITGEVGGTTALTTLTVAESDNASLAGATTTGAQSITSDAGVTLSGEYFPAGGFTIDTDDAGTTLTVTLASNVLIDTDGGAVNLNPDAANAAVINVEGATVGQQSLTIDAGAGTVALQNVGATTPLHTVRVTSSAATGTTLSNAGAATTVVVNTVGDNTIDFGGSTLTLAADTTLDATGGAVNPEGADIILAAVNADAAASNRNLTLEAGTAGVVRFTGNVGATRLDALAVTSASRVEIGDGDPTAALTINAGQADGSITIAQEIVLLDNVTLDTDGGADQAVALGQVDGDGDGTRNLTITTGVGAAADVTIGEVGQTEALGTLDINAGAGATTTLNGAITANSFAADGIAGDIDLGADVAIDVDGALDLSNATDLDATTAGQEGLWIDADTAQVDLGPIGATARLKSLAVSGTGNVDLTGNVTADAVNLAGLTGGVDVDASLTIDISNAVGDLELRGTTTTLGDDFDLTVTTAAGSDATLGDIVDTGADSVLDLDGAGDLTLTGDLGTSAAAPLGTLNLGTADFTGTTIVDGANVRVWVQDAALDAGGTTIQGATAGQNPLLLYGAAQAITLGGVGTLQRLGDLTINTTGALRLTGAAVNASSFTEVGVGTVVINTDVTIDTSADNGDVSFASPVDADGGVDDTLTITAGSGAVTLQNVGATTALEGLSASGGTVEVDVVSVDAAGAVLSGPRGITLAGNVTTTAGGAVSATGPVTLGADVTINTDDTAADGNVTLDGTVNGAQALSIDAGAAGDVSITGEVGGTTALTTLTVAESDNASLAGATTTGAQSITSDAGVTLSGEYFPAGGITIDADATPLVVTLASDVLIDTDGGAVNFNPDAAGGVVINIEGTTVGQQSLTIDAGAGAVALQNVGATTPLHTVRVTSSAATGTTLSDAADDVVVVNTVGDNTIDFGGSTLTLAADTTLDATGGAVNPEGADIILAAVNADAAASNRNLTLEAGTAGVVRFTGNVGATRLDALAVTSASRVEIGDGDPAAALTINAGQDDGDITISQALVLSDNVTIDTVGTGRAVALGQVDGDGNGARNLTITTGTAAAGNVTLGEVGQTEALNNVSINDGIAAEGTTTLSAVNTTGTLTIDTAAAGTVALGGDINVDSFDATGILGTVVLDNTLSIATNDTAISFEDAVAVNAASAGVQGLTVQTGVGQVDLGVVGATRLSALSIVNTTGNVDLNGDVTADAVNLANLLGGVDVDAAVTIDVTGAAGDLDLRGTTATLGGGFDLTVTTATDSDVALGAVADPASDSTLDIDGGGDLTLTGNLGSAATPLGVLDLGTADFTGTTFVDAPFVGVWTDDAAAVDFGASPIQSTDAGQNSLLINTDGTTDGAITLDEVGSRTRLGNLTLNAGTSEVNLEADVTAASLAVTATGGVDLIADVVIDTSTDNGAVTFTAGTNIDAAAANAQALTINAGTGDVTLQAVGGTAVSVLAIVGDQIEVDTVSAGAGGVAASGPLGVTLGGDVTTAAGPVRIIGPVTLAGDVGVMTAGGPVTVDGAIDAAGAGIDFSVDAGAGGDVDLRGPVGNITPVTTATVTNSDTLRMNGVVSTGAQTYTSQAGTTISGTYQTTGAAIDFNTADVTVLGNAVVTTGAAAGAITFGAGVDVNGTSTGNDALRLDAGTGNITLQTVGATVALQTIEIQSAADVEIDSPAEGTTFVAGELSLDSEVAPENNLLAVSYRSVTGNVTINGSAAAGSTDTFKLLGSKNNDAITITRTGTSTDVAAATDGRAQTFLLEGFAEAGQSNTLIIETGHGDDVTQVDVDGTALVTAPITFDGGDGSDLLQITGATTDALDEVVYNPGPDLQEGRLTYEDAASAVLMTIDFDGLEPVQDDTVAATFTINGDASDNVITYWQGPSGGALFGTDDTGLVAVDAFETIEFNNKTTLVLNGRAGDDRIELANTSDTAPDALTGITVNAGFGDDVVDGSLTSELTTPQTLNGNAGNDELTGGLGADTLRGGLGNDTLVNSPGNDTYDGADAAAGVDDTLTQTSGFDTLVIGGTPSNDTMDVSQATPSTVAADYTLLYTLTNTFGTFSEANTLVQRGAGFANATTAFPTIEDVRIVAGEGNDLIRVAHADEYTDATTNAAATTVTETTANGNARQMVRFTVLGNGPNASDRLVVQDLGLGDTIALRQAPDERSGRVTIAPAVNTTSAGGFFGDIAYSDIERMDITPTMLNGGTGTDNLGRIVVFEQDPFEYNELRQASTDINDVLRTNRNPNIDPGVAVAPPFAVPGDEDWYEFRAPKTGAFMFDVLFDHVGPLSNLGRPGLPGNGDLDTQVFSNTGVLIATSQTSANNVPNESITISVVEGQRYYLRVLGTGVLGGPSTSAAINVYDVAVTEVDLRGPQVTNVQITTAEHNLFGLKETVPALSPTPLIDALTIDFTDTPFPRFFGDFYATLDPVTASANGNYSIAGDSNGTIPIESVNVINNVRRLTTSAASTTTTFTADDASLNPTADYYNDYVLRFTTGGLAGQSRAITDYAFAGTVGTFTTTAFAATAAAGDSFVVEEKLLGAIPALGQAAGTLTLRNTALSPTADAYAGATLTFNSGPLVGESRIISTSTAIAGDNTAVLTFATPFSGTPRADDRYEIHVDNAATLAPASTVTGGINPTSFTAAAAAPLSGTSGVYDSRIIEFLTGPLAGQRQTVTSYSVAAGVGTFVTTSFTTTPTAGDQFRILPAPDRFGGAEVILTFATPLPDDRFTLTVNDSVRGGAGNQLDGESNADEPDGSIEVNGHPRSPSGDGVSGGDYVARFTVDSRPEVAVWSGGSVWPDINGNFTFDPANGDDFTNRDFVISFGNGDPTGNGSAVRVDDRAFASDDFFLGNFPDPTTGIADGFDKIAVYGSVGAGFAGPYRWLIDADNDTVPNHNVVDASNINGAPVAINYDKSAAGDAGEVNGDEVALFTGDNGNNWWFDADGDYVVDTVVNTPGLTGLPITGDFDGDGFDDLGTWSDDTFRFLLTAGTPRAWATGTAVYTEFDFGFTGVRNRPIAADLDQDGVDDIGLWVPDRFAQAPVEAAEWFFLVSNDPNGKDDATGNADGVLGARTAGTVVLLAHAFTPVPFGPDRYGQYGNDAGLPLFGNFDPPASPLLAAPLPTVADAPHQFDVNVDGVVSPLDVLLVVTDLSESGARPLAPTQVSARFDTSGDGNLSPIDVLGIVTYIVDGESDEAEGEGDEGLIGASLVTQTDAITIDVRVVARDVDSSVGQEASGDSLEAVDQFYSEVEDTAVVQVQSNSAGSRPSLRVGSDLDELLDDLAETEIASATDVDRALELLDE